MIILILSLIGLIPYTHYLCALYIRGYDARIKSQVPNNELVYLGIAAGPLALLISLTILFNRGIINGSLYEETY